MHNPTEQELLQQLRRAIIEHTTVRFRYHTRHSRESQHAPTVREANPYGLVHIHNDWNLVAYCHLRKDIRIFRLDRMEDLELLAKTFERPANFVMQEQRSEARDITVRVLFAKEVMRWVRESRSYYTVAEEETPEGLLVTLKIRQESEIVQWLLSWGRHMRVLEPESLRRRMVEEAERMLRNHAP